MADYLAPRKELEFVLNEVAGLGDLLQYPAFADINQDLVRAVVDEAGRFCEQVVAPTNGEADRQGTALEARAVKTAPALDGVYQRYVEAGWPSLTGDPAVGGQGLPHCLGSAVAEMLQSANMAFSLLPLLTQGVITALSRYGSGDQQALYLPRLVSGEWSGTMNRAPGGQ